MQTNDALDALLQAWQQEADDLEARFFNAQAAQLTRRHFDEVRAALEKGADQLLTLTEAAKVSGYNVSTIYRHLQAGKLQDYGHGCRTLFRRGDLPKKPSKHIVALRPEPGIGTLAEARVQSARAAVTPFIRGGHG